MSPKGSSAAAPAAKAKGGVKKLVKKPATNTAGVSPKPPSALALLDIDAANPEDTPKVTDDTTLGSLRTAVASASPEQADSDGSRIDGLRDKQKAQWLMKQKRAGKLPKVMLVYCVNLDRALVRSTVRITNSQVLYTCVYV